MQPTDLRSLASKAHGRNQKLFRKLKQRPPRNLDEQMQKLHEAEFARTDCLTCANCCKTTSPRFTSKDIERLAQYFRLKPGVFIERYLHLDEDGDYVLNAAPCPFLLPDTTCSVYEVRPTACREYPHTNRKKFHQLLDITLRNTYVCPAVYRIVEKMYAQFA